MTPGPEAIEPNPEAIAWRFTVWRSRQPPYKRQASTEFDQVVRECEEWVAELKAGSGGLILVQYQTTSGAWVEQIMIEVGADGPSEDEKR